MAIADLDTYKDAIKNPRRRLNLAKQDAFTSSSLRWTDTSGLSPFPASTPSTAVALDRTSSVGNFARESIGDFRVLKTQLSYCDFNFDDFTARGTLMLYDLLSWQGGLSGTATGEQTTNLSTAALSRYTTGAGVWAGLRIWSAIGTTATVARLNYTDQAGTTSRTSLDIVWGGSTNGHNGQHRLHLVPPQQGDTGYRSVQGVTADATTGTAGNFGVMLFRPLLFIPTVAVFTPKSFDYGLEGMGVPPAVLDAACLQWAFMPSGGNFGASGLNLTLWPD